MPLALLLSPDNQAVAAITAVLEEMSVTCERPLDGVTAAKQLNSQSFDLVVVDCDNLPAAKLIFDVCRRGKGGKNPVPVAIVDGRAGLPTAFRLGAELILTKPVAKDQARNTIRTAVNRLKKEEPARVDPVADPASIHSPEVALAETTKANADGTEAPLTHYEAAPEAATQAEMEPRAMAAAASAYGQSLSEIAILSTPATSEATMSASAFITTGPEVTAATNPADVEEEGEPASSWQASEVPVLKGLEITESKQEENSPAPDFSDNPKDQKRPAKGRGLLAAFVAFALACSGLYAAWMTQPGFRNLAQPQVDRMLALVEMWQASAPDTIPVKPRVPGVPSIAAPSNGSDATQSSHSLMNAPAGTAASSTAAAANAQTTQSSSPSRAASNNAALPTANLGPTATVSATSAINKSVTDRSATTLNGNSQKRADSKNASNTVSSNSELPAEKTALVLSSKGAEKRLIRSVQPTYPDSVHRGTAEGTVVLKAVIDEDGKVTDARVVEGNALLAESALNAVKQWRYRPYLRDGKAVPFQTIVLIDFQRP